MPGIQRPHTFLEEARHRNLAVPGHTPLLHVSGLACGNTCFHESSKKRRATLAKLDHKQRLPAGRHRIASQGRGKNTPATAVYTIAWRRLDLRTRGNGSDSGKGLE